MRAIDTGRKTYTVLIIYDIVDDKRRTLMSKCLAAYGIRVQFSAYEAILTKKKASAMAKAASKLIDEKEDSLRIYQLGDGAKVSIWGTKERRPIAPDELLVF